MKKFTKLVFCIAALVILGTMTVFAETVKLESVTAEYKDGIVYVTGTTGNTTTLAVMAEIRNPAGKTMAMQTCAVANGEFSTEFANTGVVTGLTYTVYAADFNGGKWISAKFYVPETKPDDPQNPGDDDTTYAKPAYTGTWGKPVTDGKWQMGPGGYWTYSTNAMFRNTWAYIQYTDGDGKVQTGWFYFDKNGIMLTGWQKIGGVWYYLNAQNGGTYGMCLLNTVTPDGYRVDANGAWIP